MKSYMRFRLVPNQRPWMTLNWPWTAIMRSVALHACLSEPNTNKKVQQSWQTSALAVHLPLARLVSMPGIFCLLPSSSGPIVILVFYLFSAGISEQNAWELWVWIQSESTGLTLPLRVTLMNNPITLISPVQSPGYIFLALTVICVALQISE